jgi:hypothetical protein
MAFWNRGGKLSPRVDLSDHHSTEASNQGVPYAVPEDSALSGDTRHRLHVAHLPHVAYVQETRELSRPRQVNDGGAMQDVIYQVDADPMPANEAPRPTESVWLGGQRVPVQRKWELPTARKSPTPEDQWGS